MCWSYEVSLKFSALFLVMNSYYIWKKPIYWREYLLFGMFYFMMEAFQTLQWLYGQVPKYDLNQSNGIFECSTTNTNYTMFAHLLIWSQPLLFSYIGYRTSRNYKSIAKIMCIICGVVLFYSWFMLEAGLFKNNYFLVNDSSFGVSTCTNVGRTGHLVWKFKPLNIDYFPNYLTYIILCLISFSLYETPGIQIIAIGWITSMLITLIWMQPSITEMASSWCLLSIVGNLMIFAHLHLNFPRFSFSFSPRAARPKLETETD